MAKQADQELAKQLFAGGPTQSMGALEAVKEAFLAVAPGLRNFGQDVKAELTQQAAHGAHELAAALFNGSGFVMYPRGGKDDRGRHGPEQAQEHEQDLSPEVPSQEHERGGLSL